jgi:hypothetical protein
MVNTTAFVPPTKGQQFAVSGTTVAPTPDISVTATSPATDAQLVAFILANTFQSTPGLVTSVGLGKIVDPTGAGTYIVPNTELEEVGTVGGDPNGTIFTQRAEVVAPTLPDGESETDTFLLETATSATPGGPLDSNVAVLSTPLFFVSPPAIGGTVADQPVQATNSLKPFATTTIKDTDFSNTAKDVASITITDGGTATDNDGLLTGAGLSKTGVGTYTLAAPVTPGQLQTELQGLTFATTNLFGTNTAKFELDVQDAAPTGTPGAKTVTPANFDATKGLTKVDTTTSVSIVGQPPPPPGNNFHVVDSTKMMTTDIPGDPYTGPVAGIKNEYINITTDNLNVSAVTPNTFIHTGSGMDAIDVSGASHDTNGTTGNNVLDGSTGTNFLTGGTGLDQFYVDERAASQDIFTTIRNFHSGDSATVWGITQADFTIKEGDNVLPSAPGLDFAFTPKAAGGHNANLNIPGYATADLSNGKLAVSFGKTPDLPDLPGSNYMLIQAT